MFARLAMTLAALALLRCTIAHAQAVLANDKKADAKNDIVLHGTLTGLEQSNRHTVPLREADSYAVQAEARGFFTEVEVLDPDGKSIAKSSRFTTFQAARDGAYQLLVTSPGGSAGQYTITIRRLELSKEPTGVINIGKNGFTMDTLLKSTDPPDKVRKSPSRVYQVQMHAGRTYVIDMISKSFDAYLRLEDADGKRLTQDDDSGGGNNARMKWQCKSDGVYRVIATTFNRSTGLFTLKVRAEDSKTPPSDKDKN